MQRHIAKLYKNSNQVMVHSSVVSQVKNGQMSHISVEFEGEWVCSFRQNSEVEAEVRKTKKTSTHDGLMMYLLTVPSDKLDKFARETCWAQRTETGLKINKT